MLQTVQTGYYSASASTANSPILVRRDSILKSTTGMRSDKRVSIKEVSSQASIKDVCSQLEMITERRSSKSSGGFFLVVGIKCYSFQTEIFLMINIKFLMKCISIISLRLISIFISTYSRTSSSISRPIKRWTSSFQACPIIIIWWRIFFQRWTPCRIKWCQNNTIRWWGNTFGSSVK